MAHREADPLATLDGDVVELTVPAESVYLAVVRTATAGLAARLGYSLDEVEDLRIAVDEACVMLLGLPGPRALDQTLTCRFAVLPEGLEVTVTAPVSDRAVLPAEHSFAWQVLTAHVTTASGKAGGGNASIVLTKRRSAR
jgi:serine/threonine-protein kinase RsbW